MLCLHHIFSYDRPVEPTYKTTLAEMYDTVKNVKPDAWIQMMKPGIDGTGDVKVFDDLVLSVQQLNDIDKESIKQTSNSKMLSIPNDTAGNAPSISQIYDAVCVYVSQNDSKPCTVWNWTTFCQSLNMHADSLVINCLKYWIYHCIFKQDATHIINVAKYLLQEQIQKYTNWMSTGQATSVHPIQCEVTVHGILDIRNAVDAPEIQIPCLDMDISSIQDIVDDAEVDISTRHVNQQPVPELENDNSEAVSSKTAADYQQYGIKQVQSKKQNSNHSQLHASSIFAKHSNLSKTTLTQLNATEHWFGLVSREQRAVQNTKFDFQCKNVAVIGKWPQSGKYTRAKVKELIKEMNGVCRHQVQKKDVLIVLGPETVRRTEQINRIFEFKSINIVVKPEYLYKQSTQLLSVDRAVDDNAKLWYTNTDLVKCFDNCLSCQKCIIQKHKT